MYCNMVSFLLFFLIFATSIIFIFLFPWHEKSTKKPPLAPGPRGLPFIGNLQQFDNLNPHLYLDRLSKKYGPLMSMKLGKVSVIVISSARMAKEVLTKNDLAFSSRPQLTSLQKFSYGGRDIGFSPYNDYWRELRKLSVLHLFSLKQVNSFRPVRQHEVSYMIKDVSNKANMSMLVNLSETATSLSSSIICQVAFGKSFRETSCCKRSFDELLKRTQAAFSGFFLADYIPSLGWVDKLNGMVARLDKCFEDLDSFYQELIDEHTSPNKPQSTKDNILDCLIQLREEKTSSMTINWDYVKGVLMNVFIGGTETSSAVIIWTMTILVKTPSIMKIVQEEIRGIVGKKGVVDEDDIQKLPYLKAVIKEAMRMYPPVPLLLPRETTEKCFISEYEIQPKTLAFVNFWSISRDPEYWKNPNEFCPDRFLNSTIDYKGQDFGFIPFGFGRRGCPGMSLGIATVELALANLLYSFNWKLPDGMTKEDIDTDCLPGIVMHKKNALCLMATSYI